MPANFKQHRLISENYARSRTLGIKSPHNLGVVSNRPDVAEDMEEGMKMDMKHMHRHPHDDMDDEDMKHHKDQDHEDEDLGVGHDNDLDDAEDSELGDDMDDMDDSDDNDDSDDGDDDDGDDSDDGEDDDEYGDDEDADELDAMHDNQPPAGRPHDAAAYMTRHMNESKKGPPWLEKKKEKLEKKEEKTGKDLDHDGEKGESKKHKEKIKNAKKKHEKDCKCKECTDGMMKEHKGKEKHGKDCKCKKCSSGMMENSKATMSRSEFARKIAEQYWMSNDNKSYSGMIEEDMLIPSKEIPEPGPGEVGYAPQTRVGAFDGKALAEAVQHLIRKVERLERKINQGF